MWYQEIFLLFLILILHIQFFFSILNSHSYSKYLYVYLNLKFIKIWIEILNWFTDKFETDKFCLSMGEINCIYMYNYIYIRESLKVNFDFTWLLYINMYAVIGISLIQDCQNFV